MALSPLREGRLTASNFAAAMGLSRYASRAKVFREMTGRIAPFEGNAATRWGQRHEPRAVGDYERLTGSVLAQAGEEQNFHIHPAHDWLGCTPDGFTEERLVEIKCPYSEKPFGLDRLRFEYMPQVQGQMEIVGLEEVDLVCWTRRRIEVWRIARSRDYWAWMLGLLHEFKHHLDTDTPPPRLRGKPTFGDTIRVRRFRRDPGRVGLEPQAAAAQSS